MQIIKITIRCHWAPRPFVSAEVVSKGDSGLREGAQVYVGIPSEEVMFSEATRYKSTEGPFGASI